MLPSASRLKRKSDFGKAYARGRSYVTDLIVVYVLPTGLDTTRVGFSVSKKTGKSVVRNRIKRLLREAVRAHLADMPVGYDLVIVARRKAAGLTLEDALAAFARVLEKTSIWRARG